MIRITGLIRSTDSVQLDGNYGPYNTTQEAHEYLSSLIPPQNKVGVTVGIEDLTTHTIEEFWYQGGTTEAHLVKKETDTTQLEQTVDGINENYLKAGQSSGSSSVDFDAFADTIHNNAQILSSTQKQQARQNIDAQKTLESGVNIKTINGESLIGSGNITIDYSELSNLPQINSITLSGNKSASDLGLATSAQGTKADNAIPMPAGGTDEYILAKDSNETAGVKWVNKPSDGKSALQIYNETYGTNLDEAQFINVLKQNYPMEYVAYNQTAAEQPIGTGFASIGALTADATTAGKMYLMPNNGTTPDGTILFVTVQTGVSTYVWYKLGDLDVPSNVLTEDDIDNNFAGGIAKIASAEEAKTLKENIGKIGQIVEVTDNTYYYLLLDKDNKIIAGVKHDGTLVFNSSIVNNGNVIFNDGAIFNSEEINLNCDDIHIVKKLNISGEEIDIDNVLKIRGNQIDYIDSPNIIYAITDSQNRVIFSISDEGVVYLPKITSPTIDDKEDKSNNILHGKKWVVIGDSFTEGYGLERIAEDGFYKGKFANYAYLIGNKNGMDIVKFFLSGRTLAFPAVPEDFTNSLTCPSIEEYYQNIPADADYITIYLGINDSHHAPGSSGGDGEDNTGEIPLGESTDSTTATFYGAWNVVLSWLRTNRPFAHVGIIVSNGCETIDYSQATKEMAIKYGYPYIDLNGDRFTPAMIRPQNPNIPASVKDAIKVAQRLAANNTHPNTAAHLFESAFIEQFLRTI